jgi:signal transduction histidine kinase
LILSSVLLTNGLTSPLLVWFALQPLLALYFSGYKSSIVWFFVIVIEIAFVGIISNFDFIYRETMLEKYYQLVYISSIIGFIGILFFTVQINEESRKKYQNQLLELNNKLIQSNEELNIQTEEITAQRDMLYEMTTEMERNQKEIIQMNLDLEKKVAQRTKELSDAYNELDTFIYRSAHDIKGPVTTISGLVYVALMDVKEEKSVMYLNKIKDQTKKTLDLLTRITSISEFKNKPANHQLIDFNIIELRINKYLAEEEEVEFVDVKINLPDKSTIFYSDQKYIELIILNLLDNGIKFRDSFKNKKPYVILDVNVKDEYLTIRVEDNGIGIHDNLLPLIYNMFFKGTDRSKGSGLGLYIVRLIVEKLGGQISLENHEKNKTVFLVKIPQLLPLPEIKLALT